MNILPMSLVGQINVVGNCYVYGLAVHDHLPVYLNMAGAGTSVDAAHAKLAQGKPLHIVFENGDPARELVPKGEGSYTRFQVGIKSLGASHQILIHNSFYVGEEKRDVFAPYTYMLLANKEQATALLGHHVQRIVKVAVFPEWHPYLVQQGRIAGLMEKCDSYGGIQVWAISLDADRWTEVITNGLNIRDIELP